MAPTGTPAATATAAPPPSNPPPPALVPAPLTGLLVTPEAARRHVIAVMIDDQVDARPQSGFSSASIVWHAPAEGGIPRYMLVFQETVPKSVGPVRSSRLYYVSWASELKALYAHAGGSPQALATLRAKGRGQYVYNAEVFRWEGRYFHRTRTRSAPHNVYTSGDDLRKLEKRLGAKDGPLKWPWRFAEDAPLDARPYGGSITAVYPANKVVYRYDRKTNTYLRSVTREGKQFDANDGERVAPKNVIVMVVSFHPIGDKKHRLEADLIGSGRAWISTNGRTVKGTWKKSSFTGATKFFGPDGKAVTLTVGQTFIQVLPRGWSYTITPGSDTPPTTTP